MSLYLFFLILASALVLLVVGINKLHLHPVICLLIVSIGTGLAFGMPPINVIKTINTGFGQMLSHIGLVIILGCIIGDQLEKSGAAHTIALSILKWFGRRDPLMAIIGLGGIIGIPVFCDTGFILLSKINEGIAKDKRIPFEKLSVGLAGGLYSTHTLVPPTPGPIASAGSFGMGDQLGYLILTGAVISAILVVVVRIVVGTMDFQKSEPLPLKDNFTQTVKNSGIQSFGLLALPIILISAGTITRVLGVGGSTASFINFLGHPVSALLITSLLGMRLLVIKKLDMQKSVKHALIQAGPILILTGAGGAFGQILKDSSLNEVMTQIAQTTELNLFLFLTIGFVISALLKTAQGSSTSAIVITSSILAPLATGVLNDSMSVTLLIMAIGGGSLFISHANDSYFWVVSQFSNLTMKRTMQTFTLLTAVQGITVLVLCYLISLII